MGTGMGTRL